jgi:predicted acyltransferase
VFSILTLIGYWVVLYFFGDPGDPYSLEGNAALKLDLWLIGTKNLYTGEGIPFDPEGLLSTLPSVVNVIAGFLAGKFIQQIGNNKRAVKALLLAGLIAIGFSLIWDLAFPINKKIWTSPYVLLTVGLDLIVLGFLVLVIEVQKFNKWTYPLEVFGRNPLILYVFSWIVIGIFHSIPVGKGSLKDLVYASLFTSWLGPKLASFAFALAYMMLIWSIGYLMDKRKIYIKV